MEISADFAVGFGCAVAVAFVIVAVKSFLMARANRASIDMIYQLVDRVESDLETKIENESRSLDHRIDDVCREIDESKNRLYQSIDESHRELDRRIDDTNKNIDRRVDQLDSKTQKWVEELDSKIPAKKDKKQLIKD